VLYPHIRRDRPTSRGGVGEDNKDRKEVEKEFRGSSESFSLQRILELPNQQRGKGGEEPAKVLQRGVKKRAYIGNGVKGK